MTRPGWGNYTAVPTGVTVEHTPLRSMAVGDVVEIHGRRGQALRPIPAGKTGLLHVPGEQLELSTWAAFAGLTAFTHWKFVPTSEPAS